MTLPLPLPRTATGVVPAKWHPASVSRPIPRPTAVGP